MKTELKRGERFGGAKVTGTIPMDAAGNIEAIAVASAKGGLFLVPKPEKRKGQLVQFSKDEKQLLLWAALHTNRSLSSLIRSLVADYAMAHRGKGLTDFPEGAAERVALLRRVGLADWPLPPADK